MVDTKGWVTVPALGHMNLLCGGAAGVGAERPASSAMVPHSDGDGSGLAVSRYRAMRGGLLPHPRHLCE